jgi:hypothetical protein
MLQAGGCNVTARLIGWKDVTRPADTRPTQMLEFWQRLQHNFQTGVRDAVATYQDEFREIGAEQRELAKNIIAYPTTMAEVQAFQRWQRLQSGSGPYKGTLQVKMLQFSAGGRQHFKRGSRHLCGKS